jgi:hypothetical protein
VVILKNTVSIYGYKFDISGKLSPESGRGCGFSDRCDGKKLHSRKPSENLLYVPLNYDKGWIIVTPLSMTRRDDGRLSFSKTTPYETLTLVTEQKVHKDMVKPQDVLCAVGVWKGQSGWIMIIEDMDAAMDFPDTYYED